jgi:hypothetical protein
MKMCCGDMLGKENGSLQKDAFSTLLSSLAARDDRGARRAFAKEG